MTPRGNFCWWQFPILSSSCAESSKKRLLPMLSRLPAGALKKAGAFRAATRSASVSLVGFELGKSIDTYPFPQYPAGSIRFKWYYTECQCVSGKSWSQADYADGNGAKLGGQALLGSRATLATVSLFSIGSIAWYTHLYGSLPFLGKVHANSPAEDGLHPPAYPWSHGGLLDTFDHARLVPCIRDCYQNNVLTINIYSGQYPPRLPSLPRGLRSLPLPRPHRLAQPRRRFTHC